MSDAQSLLISLMDLQGLTKQDLAHQRACLKTLIPHLQAARRAKQEDAFYDRLYEIWFQRWPIVVKKEEDRAWATRQLSKLVRRQMYWRAWGTRKKATLYFCGTWNKSWESMTLPHSKEEMRLSLEKGHEEMVRYGKETLPVCAA
ncbi:hypothetical protein BD779DRAFT_1678459 [Infundibulicybe gibba]|nr:hypothetical protein BD779DRAFT_1678459 [Infundibulicybe gibba]